MSERRRWWIVAMVVATGIIVAINIVLGITHTMRHWPAWRIGLTGGIMGGVAFLVAVWIAARLRKPPKRGRPAKSPVAIERVLADTFADTRDGVYGGPPSISALNALNAAYDEAVKENDE